MQSVDKTNEESKMQGVGCDDLVGAPPHRPTIVCLCGSTRFMDAFFEAGWAETLAGKIVLSVGVCKHAESHGGEALGQEVADMLAELHKRKIDLADEILVLNVGGYVGKSTRAEIYYAIRHGKPVRWLESRPSSADAPESPNTAGQRRPGGSAEGRSL